MKSNLEEQLEMAYKEKQKDDIINHPKKVLSLVEEYFAKNKVNTTPVINTNGYHVIFNKNADSSISMMVNGKLFTDKEEISKLINEIDLVGDEYKGKRNRQETKEKIKSQAKNIGRITKVDLTRKILQAPAQTASEGRGIMMQLLRLLGRAISKSIQSH